MFVIDQKSKTFILLVKKSMEKKKDRNTHGATPCTYIIRKYKFISTDILKQLNVHVFDTLCSVYAMVCSARACNKYDVFSPFCVKYNLLFDTRTVYISGMFRGLYGGRGRGNFLRLYFLNRKTFLI